MTAPRALRSPIGRADVRAATIMAYRAVRSDPRSLRLTDGQVAHIMRRRHRRRFHGRGFTCRACWLRRYKRLQRSIGIV